jgi:hypothetical protein
MRIREGDGEEIEGARETEMGDGDVYGDEETEIAEVRW